jgi:hypothetical protein
MVNETILFPAGSLLAPCHLSRLSKIQTFSFLMNINPNDIVQRCDFNAKLQYKYIQVHLMSAIPVAGYGDECNQASLQMQGNMNDGGRC